MFIARQLVRQNAAREQMCKAKAEVAVEVVIGNPEPGPKQPRLLPIVMKVSYEKIFKLFFLVKLKIFFLFIHTNTM